ncbi:hypothetical protein FYK55_13870 [Roseiconus nitratireducens]|uniref:Uncharacterized protein n=1 Tax=Roseiconus nitratireducens TaxID=2605748 RepID=A0A5M6D523_9BACT|nr:hypothetical protein [Roseiconus nitratireducens]KAA5542618.1 hypothetical protein FYK55_13870 [Roseiconus nitratireducens]
MTNSQTDSNPEIEQQLDTLAELCCDTLTGGEPMLAERSDALLKSLLMSGFARKQGRDLRSEIESRVKDRCQERAIHRGGALTSLTDKLQKQFDDLAQRDSEQPQRGTPSKAANISSATDA